MLILLAGQNRRNRFFPHSETRIVPIERVILANRTCQNEIKLFCDSDSGMGPIERNLSLSLRAQKVCAWTSSEMTSCQPKHGARPQLTWKRSIQHITASLVIRVAVPIEPSGDVGVDDSMDDSSCIAATCTCTCT